MKPLQHMLVGVLLVGGFSSALSAQCLHAYIAPGKAAGGATTLSVGGGVSYNDPIFHIICGVGQEIAYFRNAGHGALFLTPLNVTLDIQPSAINQKPWAPFATLGPSILIDRGTHGAFSFGGGVNYWFRKDDLALRLEFKDHTALGTRNFYEFRIGFSKFRMP